MKFIPPAGAMRFEVTQDYLGEPTPEHLKPYILWVSPREEWHLGSKFIKFDCPHESAFRVIAAGIPKHLKHLGISSSCGVCECVGRIIR